MIAARNILLIAVLLLCCPVYAADWTTTVACGDDRVYVDTRGPNGGGGGEYCRLDLPGSLWVKDGPERWWFSDGNFGEEGGYHKGRKIGPWKECTRFNDCIDTVHELRGSEEAALDVIPELPVSFQNSRYVFDFKSCWATWVTYETAEQFVELNIGGSGDSCQITYIVSYERGEPGNYFCEVPRTLGTQAFATIDLRAEFAAAGLPAMCRQN